MNIHDDIIRTFNVGGGIFFVFYFSVRLILLIFENKIFGSNKNSWSSNFTNNIVENICRTIRGSGILISGLNDILLIFSLFYVLASICILVILLACHVVSDDPVFLTQTYLVLKHPREHVLEYGLTVAICAAVGYAFRGFVAPLIERIFPSFFENPSNSLNSVLKSKSTEPANADPE